MSELSAVMNSTTVQSYSVQNSTASTAEQMSPELEMLHRIDDICWIYILPVIIIIGNFGNTFSIIVIRKSKLGETSIGFYIFAYAVVNLLCLNLFYGLDWLFSVAKWQKLENMTDWGCRFWQFIYRVLTYSGIWFLVSAMVDRYISVCHYRSAQAMCQLFMAKVAVAIVLIGIVVVSVHAMWSFELQDMGHGNLMCRPQGVDLYTKIWSWMSACCYAYIPLLALFVLSFLLIFGICTRHRGATIPVQDDVPVDLTYTVLSLSVIFFLIVSPATIINIIDNTLDMEHYPDHIIYRLHIGRTLTNFIHCGNPAVLFFVIVISSSSFRLEMTQLCVGGFTKMRRRNFLNDLKHNNSMTSEHLESHSNDTLL